MKERPILFSGQNIPPIIDGSKTQTRRIVNFKRIAKQSGCRSGTLAYSDTFKSWAVFGGSEADVCLVNCPYGKVGEILWVRESHYLYGRWHKNGTTKRGKQKWRFAYVKSLGVKFPDDPPEVICKKKTESGWFKRSSLFMPFWACRIKLEITKIRVERLQDISEEDAIKEGVTIENDPAYIAAFGKDTAKLTYQILWESINGHGSWEKNPFVWVIEFKRI